MSNINRDDPNVSKPAPAEDQEDNEAANTRDNTDEPRKAPSPQVTTNPGIKNY